jgi:hypothetical protein
MHGKKMKIITPVYEKNDIIIRAALCMDLECLKLECSQTDKCKSRGRRVLVDQVEDGQINLKLSSSRSV